jgi:glycosyltransferase involved in cell wall biosynthesis
MKPSTLNPFSSFDKIYCINLDSRPDRWEQVKKEFERAGIQDLVERFPAIAMPENPSRGNHLSHAQCIRMAKESGASNVLIFEDDLEWIQDPLLIKRAIQQLPDDWDLFYLGVNTEKTAYQVDYHIAKLTFAYSTHAYAVNHTLFDKLIELNEDTQTVHNDVRMSYEIVPHYNAYSTIPLLAGQRKSYSDIMGKVMDSNPVFTERFDRFLIPKYFPVSEPTFVTFVVPTMGRASLPRTVESIINQKDWNWKAVVMFDGREPNYSTDNNHVLVTKCDHKSHAGLVRNEGMKLVTTDWLAFVDDDDWITNDYVDSLRNYSQDKDLVIFSYKDTKTGNVQPPPYHNDFVACNVGISFAVRTAFIIRNRIQFDTYSVEDFRFLDSCRQAGARYTLTHQIKYLVGGIGGWRA